MKKKKIILTVTNNLVSDQRVHKMATSLQKAGYEIELIGRDYPKSKALKRSYKTFRMRLIFKKGAFFYAEYNFRLWLLLFFRRYDLLISNDLDTLTACYFSSQLKRKPLFYDSHEYFTEVPELIERRRVQKIWRKIEEFIFPKLKNVYTVCKSIADIYTQKYKVPVQVVRNVPECNSNGNTFADNSVATALLEKTRSRKIILYQGAVNIGRGIEHIIKAMPFLPEAVFWVVGDGDVLNEMKGLVSELQLNDNVFFTGKIPFEQLPSITRLATIGVSVEENLGLNYFYALPNKLFDYIHAEIPVLASSLPEIARIVKGRNIGLCIETHKIDDMVINVRKMFSGDNYNEWRSNLRNVKHEYCWELEVETVLKMIEKELKNKHLKRNEIF